MKLEFPILVYHEENGWVVHSLLTSTAAVAGDMSAALSDVCDLLDAEIGEALSDTEGDMRKAIAMIAAPAPPEFWARFFAGSHALPELECALAYGSVSKPKGYVPDVHFPARQVGEGMATFAL